MAKASVMQNSFNAGELSPQLKGRADIDKYKNGCDTMTNFLPQIYGPARKRPGTRFVNEVGDSSKAIRLVPFEYSTQQAYAIEFGDYYIRFHSEGGTVLSAGVPYEIVSPYSEADIENLDFAQSADVIYIAHPNHAPRKLGRYAATNWTLTVVDFDWPPFNDQNTESTTITASAITGTGITLTASAAMFSSAMVGTYFKFEEVIESKYDIWQAAKAVTSGALRHYDGNLYEATSSGTTGIRPPIHYKDTESDGAVNWIFRHDGAGYAKITAYTSTTVVTADVVSRLPTSATSATTKWSEGSWSSNRGYPTCVTFYEDRLWFAGSASRPQTIWASVTGDYENHKYGVSADDGLNFTINTQDMNTIEWMSPGKVLSIGTANGEFTLSATNLNDAVTPTDVLIKPQTNYGSSALVRPIRVAGSILFVQRANRKLREYVYNFQTDAYIASNLTVLAEHITKTGIVDLTYQQEPYQIVWAPCANGELIGLTFERAEEVVGWHRQDIGGFVESVVALPHWEADQDVLWMVVRRTINGQTKRYIEYIEKYYSDEYAFYVDCGLTYDGVPADVITGLDHLEGEEVAVLVDGAVHPNVTVVSGQVTLQYEGSVINIGLPYIATVKTMPMEAGAADGVAQGKTMRVNNIVIRLHETGPGLWYGPNANSMDEYHVRRTTNNMNAPVPLFTGDTALLPWPGEYQQSPQITIQHRLPLPCTLVAVMPQVFTYDR